MNCLQKSQNLNLIIYQIIWENINIIIYEMPNFPLVHRTFKKILFIISTSEVCLGSSSSLGRVAHDRVWYQDEKAGLEIYSGFNFQWFKWFLSIRSCMIMCLSLVNAWATPSTPAGLLNPSAYSTFWKLLVHSSTIYSSSNSIKEGHFR